MPRVNVPGKETHHHCVVLDLPDADTVDAHLIATTPSIDNAMVMHHIVVWACQDGNKFDFFVQ